MRQLFLALLLAGTFFASLKGRENSKQQRCLSVNGRIVVAFFPPTTYEMLREDPDLNEALSDFQFYAGEAQVALPKLGIGFRTIYTNAFCVSGDKESITFVTHGKIGYFFFEPGRKPDVHYGVETDVGIEQRARRYFQSSKQRQTAIR